ncbi:MAG TPA: 4Fe-4S binding protein, partial [Thermoanaerobaculia bacterium]|nr:4Fe-4S binding protein [Thermoanaerobaculia bacterium]
MEAQINRNHTFASPPPPVAAPREASSPQTKKRLVRRRPADSSQRWRHLFQIAFLLLNAVLGAELYVWVVTLGGSGGPSAGHPAGVEGWLPIAGLMNLKYWLVSGHIPAIHPAAMFLLIAFFAIALLLRKAFCSWLCPVGTLSEGLWRLGRKVFGRNVRLPRGLDLPLRGMKYVLLGFFVWAVAGMSAAAINGFMRSPYGVIADVKMLDFFRFLGTTGVVVIGLLVVGSILVKDFWCRYLCPYGALLGIVSLLSPTAIR